MGRIAGSLTYANVVATLALFVALGGGAYAISKIGPGDIKRNAVHSKHVKKAAIKSRQLNAGAVTAGKVGPDAIRGDNVADKSLTGADIDESTLTGLLAADRLFSNTVDATQETAEGTVIFRDPRTGLEAQVGSSGRLRLVNTNAEAALTVKGVGYFASTSLHGVSFTLPPGGQTQLAFDAAGFGYANLIVQRRSSQPGAAALQLTCMLEYADPLPAMSCVGLG